MPWSTVVDQDSCGQEGHRDSLGCPTFQCALNYRVRNRFLCGHRLLQISPEQESGCHLSDIIRDILGFCIIIRTERFLPGEQAYVSPLNLPYCTAVSALYLIVDFSTRGR